MVDKMQEALKQKPDFEKLTGWQKETIGQKEA